MVLINGWSFCCNIYTYLEKVMMRCYSKVMGKRAVSLILSLFVAGYALALMPQMPRDCSCEHQCPVSPTEESNPCCEIAQALPRQEALLSARSEAPDFYVSGPSPLEAPLLISAPITRTGFFALSTSPPRAPTGLSPPLA